MQVAGLKAQIEGLKTQVRKLKAHVEATKPQPHVLIMELKHSNIGVKRKNQKISTSKYQLLRVVKDFNFFHFTLIPQRSDWLI